MSFSKMWWLTARCGGSLQGVVAACKDRHAALAYFAVYVLPLKHFLKRISGGCAAVLPQRRRSAAAVGLRNDFSTRRPGPKHPLFIGYPEG
jgi:hypothetical protein